MVPSNLAALRREVSEILPMESTAKADQERALMRM